MTGSFDRVTKSNDRASEAHKDPIGLDFAARCVVDDLSDFVAKVRTGDMNAKTTSCIADTSKTPPREQQGGDAAVKASLALLGSDIYGSGNKEHVAQIAEQRTFGKVLNPQGQPKPWELNYAA